MSHVARKVPFITTATHPVNTIDGGRVLSVVVSGRPVPATSARHTAAKGLDGRAALVDQLKYPPIMHLYSYSVGRPSFGALFIP